MPVRERRVAMLFAPLCPHSSQEQQNFGRIMKMYSYIKKKMVKIYVLNLNLIIFLKKMIYNVSMASL